MDLMLGRIFTFFSYFFILSILASWYIELRVFFLAAYIYLTGVAGGGGGYLGWYGRHKFSLGPCENRNRGRNIN